MGNVCFGMGNGGPGQVISSNLPDHVVLFPIVESELETGVQNRKNRHQKDHGFGT